MRERNEYGRILLRYAAMHRSVEFIKVLVEANGGVDCVQSIDSSEELPFHLACGFCNLEVAKYLHSLYPESINIPNNEGECALHRLLRTDLMPDEQGSEEDHEEFFRYLLLHDQGAVSTPDGTGSSPLHIACMYEPISIVKLVYNACPEALHRRYSDGDTHLDVARDLNHADVVAFLEAQMELERQAHDDDQPDEKGQLPIHRVLRTSEPGTIKLMAAANPASLTVPDIKGYIPLHSACKLGRFDVVKYLIEANEELLKVKTSRGYLPLHLACLGGNCNIVKYILERSNDYGVSLRANGKLPIELLLSDFANCDRDSLEYVQAVGLLLRANPESINANQEEHALQSL